MPWDFIPEMIQEGEKRYGDISALTFVEGDVRYLKLDRNDYEFAFTSDFNHLLSRDDCMAALTGIRQALRPKAGLGLELSFPATESWNKPWQTFEPLTSQLDIAIKDSAILKTWKKGKTSYDAVSRVTSIEQEIFIKQGKTVEQFPHNFQLKLWDSQEISAMLQEAGFSLNNEYGSYKLEPWTTKSHRWIIEAVKNSS